MKKNAMLKIAAVLLVAVLLTTCAISSTFAKYVSTKGTQTARARVAKWGVTTEMALNSDFGMTYGSNGDAGRVVADSGVVAPGTMGKLEFEYTISGSTEVSGKIEFDVVVTNDREIPLVFSLDGSTYDLTAADLEDELALADITFEPGETFADTKYTGVKEIYWMWDYEVSAAQDLKDTALADPTNPATFSIEISVQATQTGPAMPNANPQ